MTTDISVAESACSGCFLSAQGEQQAATLLLYPTCFSAVALGDGAAGESPLLGKLSVGSCACWLGNRLHVQLSPVEIICLNTWSELKCYFLFFFHILPFLPCLYIFELVVGVIRRKFFPSLKYLTQKDLSRVLKCRWGGEVHRLSRITRKCSHWRQCSGVDAGKNSSVHTCSYCPALPETCPWQRVLSSQAAWSSGKRAALGPRNGLSPQTERS